MIMINPVPGTGSIINFMFWKEGCGMKVTELAKLTGLNAETIRKYRERGLLKPRCQPENGYYEYSFLDLLNLLYIRKLRGANLSLDTIASTYTGGDAESLLAGYRSTIETLDEQIRILTRRRRMLMLTYRHYERDAAAGESVRLIESFGDKYDSYLGDTLDDPAQKWWVENVDLFTLVVGIERRYFEQEELPEHVPIRIGLGTYEPILKENSAPLPAQYRLFPQGTYASFFLEVEDLDTVPAAALQPVRTFLAREHLRPLGDTTAYLYRVDYRDGVLHFIFCMRIQVEKTES